MCVYIIYIRRFSGTFVWNDLLAALCLYTVCVCGIKHAFHMRASNVHTNPNSSVIKYMRHTHPAHINFKCVRIKWRVVCVCVFIFVWYQFIHSFLTGLTLVYRRPAAHRKRRSWWQRDAAKTATLMLALTPFRIWRISPSRVLSIRSW